MYWADVKDAPSSFGRVGNDVYIADTVVLKRRELFHCGNHVAIDDFCVFTTQVQLGSYIHIPPHCTVIGGKDVRFHMGDFASLAAGCRIICASDEYKGAGLISPLIPDAYRDNVIRGSVVLGDYASCATNVVLSPGVVLEQGAVVGANSYVPAGTFIPAWQIWAGSPARFIAHRKSVSMMIKGETLLKERP